MEVLRIISTKDCSQTYVFEHGSKRLELFIDPKKEIAETDVSTIPKRDKKNNETTKIYSEAARVLQETVDRLDKKIEYRFVTGNNHMIQWALARNKGRELFNWDSIDRSDFLSFLVAKKTIYPTGYQRKPKRFIFF